jgi:DNA-binding protein HU-beta
MQEALSTGEKITLVGFGSFDVSKRDARKGRNPKTGEEIAIAAKSVVRFKSGKELTESVNS